MKKFLAILAVAGVMAACNSGNDEATTDTTTVVPVDTMTTAPVIDTTAAGDTTKTAADTTKK